MPSPKKSPTKTPTPTTSSTDSSIAPSQNPFAALDSSRSLDVDSDYSLVHPPSSRITTHLLPLVLALPPSHCSNISCPSSATTSRSASPVFLDTAPSSRPSSLVDIVPVTPLPSRSESWREWEGGGSLKGAESNTDLDNLSINLSELRLKWDEIHSKGPRDWTWMKYQRVPREFQKIIKEQQNSAERKKAAGKNQPTPIQGKKAEGLEVEFTFLRQTLTYTRSQSKPCGDDEDAAKGQSFSKSKIEYPSALAQKVLAGAPKVNRKGDLWPWLTKPSEFKKVMWLTNSLFLELDIKEIETNDEPKAKIPVKSLNQALKDIMTEITTPDKGIEKLKVMQSEVKIPVKIPTKGVNRIPEPPLTYDSNWRLPSVENEPETSPLSHFTDENFWKEDPDLKVYHTASNTSSYYPERFALSDYVSGHSDTYSDYHPSLLSDAVEEEWNHYRADTSPPPPLICALPPTPPPTPITCNVSTVPYLPLELIESLMK